MVIDTSALIAILRSEPEAAAFTQMISEAANCYMSAVSLLEASIIAQRDRGIAAARNVDALIQLASIKIEPFDQDQSVLAREAYAIYGKGNHPARLNFGDCASYALAKFYGEPLLFKGKDFTQTDVTPATDGYSIS